MATNPPTDNRFILNPAELGQKILEWKRLGYHVLSPAIQVSTFAPGYGVNASLVLLDPNIDGEYGSGTDVYYDKNTMKEDQRAPSKIGLMKISAAAGVNWVAPYGRVDPLTIQNLWIYQVTGVYLAYDGTPQVIKGEKEIDYRDGSAQIGEWTPAAWAELVKSGSRDRRTINGWSDMRVRQARCNGGERAETGALERAIRTLGVKHTYTLDELARPFVTLRVCPMMDLSDPATRALVADRNLKGVAALFSGPAARLTLGEGSAADLIDVMPAAVSRAVERRQPAYATARQTEPVAAPPAAVAPPVAPPVHAAPPPPPAPTPAPPPAVATAPPEREPGADDDDETGPALPPDAVLVTEAPKVEQRPYSANHRRAGEMFTKWTVRIHGKVCETVYPRWGNAIVAAFTEKTPVVVKLGPESQYHTFEIMNVERIKAPAPAPAEMHL